LHPEVFALLWFSWSLFLHLHHLLETTVVHLTKDFQPSLRRQWYGTSLRAFFIAIPSQAHSLHLALLSRKEFMTVRAAVVEAEMESLFTALVQAWLPEGEPTESARRYMLRKVYGLTTSLLPEITKAGRSGPTSARVTGIESIAVEQDLIGNELEVANQEGVYLVKGKTSNADDCDQPTSETDPPYEWFIVQNPRRRANTSPSYNTAIRRHCSAAEVGLRKSAARRVPVASRGAANSSHSPAVVNQPPRSSPGFACPLCVRIKKSLNNARNIKQHAEDHHPGLLSKFTDEAMRNAAKTLPDRLRQDQSFQSDTISSRLAATTCNPGADLYTLNSESGEVDERISSDDGEIWQQHGLETRVVNRDDSSVNAS
jgi:hypothetical protein